MKLLGIIILIIGISMGIHTLNMSTSIPVIGALRIENDALGNQKTNYFIFSGLLIIIGVILLVAGSRNNTMIKIANSSPVDAERTLQEKKDIYKGYQVLGIVALVITIILVILSLMR